MWSFWQAHPMSLLAAKMGAVLGHTDPIDIPR